MSDAASQAGRKFALPKLALPKWLSFDRPKKAINSVRTFISSAAWSTFAEGITPDRRKYEVCYFPLAIKNEDGSLSYFGTFVPDLLERARAEGDEKAFEKAILLPKKAYALDAEGKLSLEDLTQVARQVEKEMANIAIVYRKSGKNLNLYNVERMPAQNLYFDAKSGVAQSVAAATVGDLINIYGGARPTAYQLPFIKPSKSEYALHIALNWFSQAVALVAAIGVGLAFMPVAPLAGLAAGLTTFGVVNFAQQFDFWLKAEDLILNNWLLSSSHRQAKQLDWYKIAKTVVVTVMTGYLAIMGGFEAYAVASSALVKLASLSMLQSTVLALGSAASVGIKAFSGLLGITAAVGAFRGSIVVMHNFFGLGYAKTTVTGEERKALPVVDILAKNAEKDLAYKAKKNPAQVSVDPGLSTTLAQQTQKIEHLTASLAQMKQDLIKAQTPCVSKVVAMAAVFYNLVEQGKIPADLDLDGSTFDEAFSLISKYLPMNLAAWPSAQVFNDLSQADKLKAIESFKNSLTNQRFSQYIADDFNLYVASERYKFDKEKFREFMKGESYQLDQPKGDCCNDKPTEQALPQASEPVIVITPASPVTEITTPTTPIIPVEEQEASVPAEPVLSIVVASPRPTFSPLKDATPVASISDAETPDFLAVPANDEQPKAGRSRSSSRERSEEQPTRRVQPPRFAKSPRKS